jgi:hypothetical protein
MSLEACRSVRSSGLSTSYSFLRIATRSASRCRAIEQIALTWLAVAGLPDLGASAADRPARTASPFAPGVAVPRPGPVDGVASARLRRGLRARCLEPRQLVLYGLASGAIGVANLGVERVQVAVQQGRVELELQAARGETDSSYNMPNTETNAIRGRCQWRRMPTFISRYGPPPRLIGCYENPKSINGGPVPGLKK